MEGFDAAPIEIASANAISTAGQLPADADDKAQFRFAGGWGSYLDWLHARLDPRLSRVLLATPVRRIGWSRGRVRLWTDGDEFRSRAVLVTLPVGVLQAGPGAEGHVRFEPDPPRLRRALAGLAMGNAVRIVLSFREPFWRRRLPRARRRRPRRAHVLPRFGSRLSDVVDELARGVVDADRLGGRQRGAPLVAGRPLRDPAAGAASLSAGFSIALRGRKEPAGLGLPRLDVRRPFERAYSFARVGGVVRAHSRDRSIAPLFRR